MRRGTQKTHATRQGGAPESETNWAQSRIFPALQEFGELVHHAGEEYIYVLKGKIIVTTEFYDPVTLGEGESIYIDSNMGHAYLAADDCDEAEVLGIMSSADDDLMQSLLDIHEEQNRPEIVTAMKRKKTGI